MKFNFFGRIITCDFYFDINNRANNAKKINVGDTVYINVVPFLIDDDTSPTKYIEKVVVKSVHRSKNEHDTTTFSIVGRPNDSFNWDAICDKQDKFKKEYLKENTVAL